ncbi:tail sheath protein [Edaphobacter aggregans]|uniref:Tail sheath protein n=1 Tax=Edaphobacter aggregans TaxID=570835 RepID=A0A428MLZ9_9BACT|nr:hypothetical protein [Edaphobacter aggregans]RSL17981.1 tail sheath protein [Edaphobacter aggregans]
MTTRLPGVYFETVVPPITSTLPRMDIAAFVGFAASGPLDVPVVIEDAGRFLEIYGQDQTLAWDPVAGETVYAQLPPTVRAFFRNGGERCWVVRVADDTAAVANEFMLPGMLLARSGPPSQAGWLLARSEGSWSDDYNVNATLSLGPIRADPPRPSAAGISVVLYPNTVTSVAIGDLLQISFDPPPASPSSLVAPILYLPVSKVSAKSLITASGAVEQTITACGTEAYWFRPAAMEDFAQLQSSPASGQLNPTVEWLVVPQSVTWLTQPQNAELWIASWGIEYATNPPTFVLDGLRSHAENIPPGSWLLAQFAAADLPEGAQQLLLLVDSVRGSKATAPGSPGSPPGDQETVQIVVNEAWWVMDDQVGWLQNLSAPRVDVVTMELWVRDGSGQIISLSNLGLTPLHPRYIGYLPTDEQLYARSDQPLTPPWSELLYDIDPPRFALAAPNDDASAPTSTGASAPSLPFYLPLGVPGLVDPNFYQPSVTQTAPALQRDGLVLPTGQITASLFLDPDLADATVDTLLTQAFHKQYQLQRGDFQGPSGEPLLKMHAILPVDEVSLLALPDAMHPGWQPAPVAPGGSIVAPNLISISEPTPQAQITASWTVVAGATSYTLQQSSDPRFASSTVAWSGAGSPDPSNPGFIQAGSFAQPSGCPSLAYFRVCASYSGITGPWSNTVSQTLSTEPFASCNPQTPDPPVLEMLPESRGRVALQWSVAHTIGNLYQVQVAYEPAFALPEIIFQGSTTYFEVWSDPSRTAYFRVGATSGNETSPWSNTVVAQSDQQYDQYWMNPPPAPGSAGASSSELLQIHQAMIRLCAARADMFAFLGLPRSYDASTCVLYQSLLTTALTPENGPTTLSFAAIYHPWLVVLDSVDEQPGAIRSVSPEGAMAGIAAALTLSTGAWLSPGNHLLQAVVDLDAQLGDQTPMTFFNNQLNLVIQEALGFLTMSSFTLSSSSRLSEINVRRLLILLRRLALREGMVYVFQPNDSTFWRRVQRRFEDVLSDLFLQGAFAGSTQSESFQVTTDSSINALETISQGQFIVDVSIAPSLPLEFLTVRLLQEGGDLTLSEET